MHIRLVVAASVILFILSGPASLHASGIDSTLFTTYTLEGSGTYIDFSVCGSLPGTSGCYGSGMLGPFGRVGVMIEGNPISNVKAGRVTRYIYVVDVAYGSGGNEVALHIYKKLDTINGGDDTVTSSLFKTVILPLTGGSATVASMAANTKFLYIGTNQDSLAVQLRKSNLAITQIGQFSGNVTAITADHYGFVTITWGNTAGFYVLSPSGQPQEDGGGAAFVVNTLQAIIPSTVQ